MADIITTTSLFMTPINLSRCMEHLSVGVSVWDGRMTILPCQPNFLTSALFWKTGATCISSWTTENTCQPVIATTWVWIWLWHVTLRITRFSRVAVLNSRLPYSWLLRTHCSVTRTTRYTVKMIMMKRQVCSTGLNTTNGNSNQRPIPLLQEVRNVRLSWHVQSSACWVTITSTRNHLLKHSIWVVTVWQAIAPATLPKPLHCVVTKTVHWLLMVVKAMLTYV
jgi:Outer membrane protein/protective antigen OMA87